VFREPGRRCVCVLFASRSGKSISNHQSNPGIKCLGNIMRDSKIKYYKSLSLLLLYHYYHSHVYIVVLKFLFISITIMIMFHWIVLKKSIAKWHNIQVRGVVEVPRAIWTICSFRGTIIGMAILLVTFLGWWKRDPFQWLSDLQLGDKKVTLNHLGNGLWLTLPETIYPPKIDG